MPINRTVKGNLITLAKEGYFDAIVHGCNCQNTMASGIAPQISKAFPEALSADRKTKKGNPEKLGKFTAGHHFFHNNRTDAPDVVSIYNLYTQFEYGTDKQYLDYKALENCFILLNKQYFGDPHQPVIGIPKIGCGLAGGDWEIVKEIINRVTPDLNITYVEYN